MACAVIRDNIRTDISDFRQINRSKLRNSRRRALDEAVKIGDPIAEGEVALLANKLLLKSAVKIQDLNFLKNAFVQSSECIVAFLSVKGALHALVRELSSTESNLQLVAVECCCNLALGSEWSCLQVAKAAGPYLIAFLSGINYNMINASVWCLGNLVGSGEKAWTVLHSQGLMSKLLQLVREHDSPPDSQVKTDIQYNTCSALMHVLRVGSKSLTSEEVNLIAKTISNVEHTSVQSCKTVEFLLSCLDAAEPELLEKKLHLKCLDYLMKTELTKDTIASYTPAVRTVANLVAETSGTCALQILKHWEDLNETFQKIFLSPYKHLVGEIGWLIGNLVHHPSQEVQLVLQEHSLDIKLLQSQFEFFSKN